MRVTETTQFWYSLEGEDTLTQVTIRYPDGTTTESLTVNPHHACMGEWAQTQHEENKEAAKMCRRREVQQAEAKYQMQRQYAKCVEQSMGKEYAKQLKEQAQQERNAKEKAARRREEEAYQKSRQKRDAQKKAAKALKEIRKKQEKIRKEQEKIRKEQEKMFGSW